MVVFYGKTAAAVSEQGLPCDMLNSSCPAQDLGVLSQTAVARDSGPLEHDETACEEALFSQPNPTGETPAP